MRRNASVSDFSGGINRKMEENEKTFLMYLFRADELMRLSRGNNR
jgi:hypothetical protein